MPRSLPRATKDIICTPPPSPPLLTSTSLGKEKNYLPTYPFPQSIVIGEDKIDVVLGTKLLRNGTEGTRQRIPVVEVIIHERHHPTSLAHDIAILKLKEPVDFNPKVRLKRSCKGD